MVRSRFRAWAIVLLPALVPVAIVQALAGHLGPAVAVLGEAVLLLTIATVAPGNRRAFLVAVCSTLALIAIADVAERVVFSSTFVRLDESLQSAAPWLPWSGRRAYTDASSPYYRAWQVGHDSERNPLELTFEARSRHPAGSGGAWLQPGGGMGGEAELHDPAVSRLSVDDQNNVWFRQATLAEAAAGRVFRTSILLRRPGGASCGHLQLSARGGGGTVRDVCVGRAWTPFQLEWVAPDNVRRNEIVVTVAGFAPGVLEARDATILEVGAGPENPTVSLGTLWPGGVRVRLAWPGRSTDRQFSVTFDPDADWHRYTIIVPADNVPSGADVTAVLEVGPGRSVELRDVFFGGNGHSATPRFLPERQKAWFTHPNFAGHAVASLVVAGSVLSAAGLAAVIFVAGMLLALVSGSRAALAAVVLAAVGAFTAREFTPRRIRFGVLALCVVAVGLASLTMPALRRSADEALRPAIWWAAVQRTERSPWTGDPGDSFATLKEPMEVAAHRVAHAHNLWLQMAAAYGLPGLLAATWLTVALAVIAWRWGRWRAVAVVGSALLLNAVDFTLFQPIVIVSVIWSLNVFHAGRSTTSTSRRTTTVTPRQ